MNVKRKTINGLNFSIDLHPVGDFHIQPGITWIRGWVEREDGIEEPASFIPQSRLSLNAHYSKQLSEKWKVSLSGKVNYYLPKDDINNKEQLFWENGRVEPYTLINGELSFEYKVSTKAFKIGIGVDNLLNEKYKGHPSIYERTQGYAPGRRLSVFLMGSF